MTRCLDDSRALRYQNGLNKGLPNQEDNDVGVNTSGGHSAMDYSEHNRTYAGFLRFTKIAIVALVVLLAGMKFFLV